MPKYLTSAVAVALLLAVSTWGTVPPMSASGPCDAVNGKPEPPTPPANPLWTGRVLDTVSDTGVSGATVRIFVCANGSATEVDDTTTDSNGDFSFTVSGGAYYYVAADMSGPLSGMTVSSGYDNPTDALGLGDSVDVDLGFE